MLSKIKKFFLSFLRLDKKTIPVLLFLILLGTLLPFHFVEAFVDLVAVAVFGKFLLTTTLFALIVSGLFLAAMSALLSFVTSPGFLAISYTVNPFVTLGWTITRDLANMFFILVLVVIALATILRIEDYQAKKALPLLIIIILLINFTPVFAGIIIDFFNILMRFFLGEGIGLDSVVWGIEAMVGGIRLALHGIDWGAIDEIGGTLLLVLLTPLLIIIYNVLAGFVFFILALLFIMRPIALMLLVILSPIAFLTCVLPATSSFRQQLGILNWTEWWKQFINWCFVGVVASFFLYLTDQLAYLVVRQGFAGEVATEEGFRALAEQGDAGGVFIAFVPFLVILSFLILGLFYIIETSAGGASHMIGAAKGVGKWAGQALAVKAGVVAARKYPDIAHGIAKGMEKMSGGLEKRGRLGQIVAKPFRYMERKAEDVALYGEEVRLKDEEKWKKKYSEKTTTDKERFMGVKSGSKEQQIGALLAIIEEFEAEDLLEDLIKDLGKEKGEDKLVEIYQNAKKINLHKNIESCYLDLHDKFGMNDEDKKKAYKRISLKPELVKYINPNAYKTESLIPELMKCLEGNLNAALMPASPETREDIVNMYQKIIDDAGGGEKGFRALVKEYRQAARYLTTGPGARNLGLSLKTGLTERDEKEIFKERWVSSTSGEVEEIEKEIATKREQIENLKRLANVSDIERLERPDIPAKDIVKTKIEEAQKELAKLKGELEELKEKEGAAAPPIPETPLKGPSWLREGIKKSKESAFFLLIPKRLEKFLRDEGVTEKEIDEMTPKDAWLKAEEILRKKK